MSSSASISKEIEGGTPLDKLPVENIQLTTQEKAGSDTTQSNVTLPQQDIPKHVTIDPNVQVNYIPQPQHQNYINDPYPQNAPKKSENIFEEHKLSILIGLLYVIIHMPIFQKKLLLYFPSWFSSTGNLTFYGNLYMAILFAGSIAMLQKSDLL